MTGVTDVPQSSPSRSALPACFGLGAALAGHLFAQSAVTLSGDTPFFKDPGGTRLGTLVAGARVTANRADGGFRQVILDGWIFTASTQPDRREGHDLSVRAPEGENLRAAPNGAVIARAVQGTLFRRVAVRGGWTRVLRLGWVPASALGNRESAIGRRGSDSGTTGTSEIPTPDFRSSIPDRLATLRAGATLQRAPDGAGLARLLEPAEVSLAEASGEWVKVRLEGWVRRSAVDSAIAPRPAITAAMLRENPDRYVGQTVDWRVQFLALQQADELRPEMPTGRPYLLVRGPLPESGFAYVMLSPVQAEEMKGLQPLEEIGLTVTIRAGRTRYLATPIVELVRRTP
jgi:hypothetical protein